jgi:hypothetical protein
MFSLCRKIIRILNNRNTFSLKSLKRPFEPNSCTSKMKATDLSDTSEHSHYPTKSHKVENNNHREGVWVSPLKFFPSFEKECFIIMSA